MSRIAPAAPPYEPAIADALERIMPPGVEPLLLFRVMARSPRVFQKLFAGGLLDRGPLSLRLREIVIDRTTARLGCEYEWGVHIALFAARIGLDEQRVAATVESPSRDAVWSDAERALIALVDDLVDRRTIGEATFATARAHFDEAQLLEAIALVGYYHTISFLCRGLSLPPESYGARFPAPAAAPTAEPHPHRATIEWQRDGSAFTDRRYSRVHRWHFDGGTTVVASSSPQLVRVPLSDPAAVDPEESFVASVASCHMLWFLDLAARAGYVVDRYLDRASGTLARREDGKHWISDIELVPEITFSGQAPTAEALDQLHQRAHAECFLANSLKTAVHIRIPTAPSPTAARPDQSA